MASTYFYVPSYRGGKTVVTTTLSESSERVLEDGRVVKNSGGNSLYTHESYQTGRSPMLKTCYISMDIENMQSYRHLFYVNVQRELDIRDERDQLPALEFFVGYIGSF